MGKYIMALDQGTTSSRCILFDKNGNMCSVAQKEYKQYYPKPGWVEHDPSEIWSSQMSVATEAMSKIGVDAEDIHALWKAGKANMVTFDDEPRPLTVKRTVSHRRKLKGETADFSRLV